MTTSPKVSIIIPYYNVDEARLMFCIDSIINQSFKDYEIVVVNDGSDERHTNILSEIQKKDNRIKIYNEQNHGVSATRNVGVAKAKGNYITFVDADDILNWGFLSEAVHIADTGSIDYVIGATLSVTDNKISEAISASQIITKGSEYKIYSGYEIDSLRVSFIADNRIIRFNNEGYINRGPVARLIRRELAQSVTFPEGIAIGEDVIWNQFILNNCRRLAMTQNIWYYYILNASSSSHKYRDDAIDVIMNEGLLLKDILDLSKDELYCAFCNKLLSETRLVVCRCYLTRKENSKSFISKWLIFNQLNNKLPWSIIKHRFFKHGDRRDRLVYLLFKTRLYFPIAYSKDRLLK